MTSLITFLIVPFSIIIYGRFYNPILFLNFMLIFQLGLGPIIRALGYTFYDSLLLQLVTLFFIASVTFGFLIGCYVFKYKNREIDLNFDTKEKIAFRFLRITYWVLFFLFFLNIYSQLYSLNLIEIRAFYKENRSNSNVSALFGVLGLLGPLIAIYYIKKKQIIMFLLTLISLLFLGKKAPFFVILIGIIFVFKPQFSLKNIFFVVIGSFSLILLHNLQSSPVLPLSPTQILAGYFDYHINLSDALQKVADKNCCFGIFHGQITLSNFWYLIPRVFYSLKPEIYGHTLIHYEFYSNELQLGYTRGIVTNIAVPFAEFGYLGLLFLGGLKGALISFFLKCLQNEKNTLLKILYFLTLLNPISPGFIFLAFLIAFTKSFLARTIERL